MKRFLFKYDFGAQKKESFFGTKKNCENMTKLSDSETHFFTVKRHFLMCFICENIRKMRGFWESLIEHASFPRDDRIKKHIFY